MFFLFSLVGMASSWSQDGFAREVTGGAGGATVSVKTAEDFRLHATSVEPLTIRVEGNLAIGSVPVGSNKTIIGVGGDATLSGNLFVGGSARNVILKNLNFTNPMNKKGKGGGDGVTVRGGKLVWITQCTFFNCGDGCVDVTDGADYVTVSWCKFHFKKQKDHRFTMLAIGREGKKHKNKLKITLHHNWWAEGCDQRMPAAKKAQAHMYNNYFNCRDNSYCSNARDEAELLSENNFYEGVRNPCYGEKGSKVKVSGNIYKDCTGKADQGDAKVFTPPYPYTTNPARTVPEIVMAGAGAR